MLKLAYQYVKQNKRNTFICIAGIALSMALVFSLIQTAEQIITKYKEMIISYSDYDVAIGESLNEEERLDDTYFQEIMELYKDRYDLIGAVNVGQFKMGEVTGYTVAGVSGDWPSLFKVELLEGKLPDTLNDICIEESFARDRNLKVGMPLRLRLYNNRGEGAEMEYEFFISGLVSDTSSGYIITTLDTANEILAQKQYSNAVSRNIIYLSIDKQDYPEEEISAVYTELTEKYGLSFIKHIKVNKAKYQIGMEKGSYYELRRALYGIVILLLVIMGIFVYYMMRVNLLGKIKQYGIFRSLGMDRRRLSELIICEVMLYSVAGILLGCLGGILLNQVMAGLILRGLIGEGICITNYSAGLFVSAVGLAIIAVILASLKIFIEIVHKKPVELLQNHIRDKTGRYTACQNIVLELAWNNANRNKGQKRVLLITMVLSLLLVILLGNGLGSIDFDMEEGVASFANIEVSAVRGAGTSYITDEDFENLRSIDGAELYWQAGLFEYRLPGWEEGQNATTAVIYSSTLMDKFRKANSLKGEEIVWCCKEGIEMPDSLRLYDGDELLAELRPQVKVLAGAKDLKSEGIPGLRNIIIIDETYANNILKNPLQITSVYLHSDNLTANDVKQMLGNWNYEYTDWSNIMKESQEQLKSMLIVVGYMMISMITLAVFLITSIVRENFEQRRGEIGMMRAAGGTKRMISHILCMEILLNLLVAALLASILAAPVSAYVYLIIKEKMGMAWQGYVFGIPIVLLGSMLVVKWNVDNCMKCNTVELLRSEE